MAKYIALSQGKQAAVDDADYAVLNQHKWYWMAHRAGNGYAVRTVRVNGKRRLEYLHRRVLGNPAEPVDHIDGDSLNDTRANLRLCSLAENNRNTAKRQRNTSGFKGVYRRRHGEKWTAMIGVKDRQIYLGTFSSPEDAARAYDAAALEHHGEFARLNFQGEG